MILPTRFAGLALSLIIAGAASLRAESVSYPEKNPAFTVDVPANWQTLFENGALKMAPKQGDVLVLFQHVTDVKDEAGAKAGLPRLAEQAGQTFSVKNGEVAVQPMQTDAGKFKTWMTAYRGKDKDNEDAFWYVATFAPKPGDYYLMTVVYSLKDEKNSAADRATIQTSIRPAASAPATTASPSPAASVAPATDADKTDADDDDDDDDDDDATQSSGIGAAAKPTPNR
jgi:hypothetical protein